MNGAFNASVCLQSVGRLVLIALGLFGAGCGDVVATREPSKDAGTGGVLSGAGGSISSAGGSISSGAPSIGGTAGSAVSSAGGAEIGRGGGAGLGSHCEMPGQLSCVGSRQKVTLICAASYTWEHNETCPGNLVCDSTPGPNLGSCQAPSPLCEGIDADEQTCDGASVVTCNQDGISTEKLSECSLGCANAACVRAPECPAAEYVNCASDCSGRAPDCEPISKCIFLPYVAPLIRTPSAAEACEFCGGKKRAFAIHRAGYDTLTSDFMFKVGEGPWGLVADSTEICTATPLHCLVVEPANESVYAVTDSKNAPPWNLTVEWVPKGTACPPVKE